MTGMTDSIAAHRRQRQLHRHEDLGSTVRWDITGYLTIWLALLFGISANQVVGPLGAIGTPALFVAAGGALIWLCTRVLPVERPVANQPMRVAMLAYLWYQTATIVMGHTRPLTSLEQSGSLRELFMLVSLTGVALLVVDGIDSIERLNTLLRRTVWAGAYLAGVGIGQFLLGRTLAFSIPGLAFNQAAGQVNMRSVFNRPFGTGLHPIEFSVVLAVLFPLALYLALESDSGSRRQRFAIVASVMIGLGIPLSISRSGIVALAGAFLVMMWGWSWRRRAQGLIVGAASIPVLWLTIPGLVGTFRGMFTSFDYDPSVQARLDRLPKIMDLIRERPVFGIGAGTYSVEDYFLIDNEFWVSTIETGIAGIILTYALFALGFAMAVTSRHHRHATPQTTHLGYAIAAGLMAVAISLWTFDAFFYHIFRGVLFLLLGAAGSLWRLTRTQPTSPHAVDPSVLDVDGMVSPRS